MTAMAARTLGYHVHVLDPGRELRGERRGRPRRRREVRRRRRRRRSRAPLRRRHARDRADRRRRARRRDASRARASESARFSPSCRIGRGRSAGSRRTDFPIGALSRRHDRSSNSRTRSESSARSFVKASHGGYDGRSQARVADAAGVGGRLGRRSAIARRSPNRRSISRRRSPSWSRDGRAARCASIRRRSTFTSGRFSPGRCIPAPLAAARHGAGRGDRARHRRRASRSREFSPSRCSCSTTATLLVNELAPRPHNSFHETEVACSTSQFEQLVRAVCDLPLGDPRRASARRDLQSVRRALARHGGPPPFERALAQPGVRLHLYGKRGARAGTKDGPSVGHRRHGGRRIGARSRRRRRARRATNLRGFA